MRTPLTDCLETYMSQDYYPMHMPGHKRNYPPLGEVCSFDVTEIPEFDDLHDATGVLKDSMEEAAALYGARESFYLVNGSSGGILAAITAFDGDILIARNCHKSVYHGVALAGKRCDYLFPARTPEGLCGGITPRALLEKLEELGKEGRSPAVVMITSPTYEGYCSDIEELARICHDNGAYLLVDEAHGAHLPFMKASCFPKSALDCGADVVIQSLHKLLPSLTQTGILHVGQRVPGELIQRIRYQLSVFQTSSPSYVLMSAIEKCLAFMDSREGRAAVDQYEELLWDFYASPKIQRLTTLRVLPMDEGENTFYRDPSKIVILTGDEHNRSMFGHCLEERLRLQYHIPMEMAAPFYVIGMTSVCDTREGMERLAEALFEIDRDSRNNGFIAGSGKTQQPVVIPGEMVENPFDIWDFGGYMGKSRCCIRDAMYTPAGKTVCIPVQESAGRISTEFVYMYPPGIPFIVPGEEITRETVALIMRLQDARMKICGSGGHHAGCICVLQ